MPIRLTLPKTFGTLLAQRAHPLVGMWVCSGAPVVAEICAGSGLDWLLIDSEHAPQSLESVQRQLQAIAAYPVTPVVRVPWNDPILIKQNLDLGAQNLLVPMINSRREAEQAVSATRYPPEGIRGVGSALARAGRWNRVDGYLTRSNDEHVNLICQIETAAAVENAFEIASTPGVDGVFIGPSDLAASLGLIGRQGHPAVVAHVKRAIEAVRRAGTPIGINAFDPVLANAYRDEGIDFILVGADVSILARGSEQLASTFIKSRGPASTSAAPPVDARSAGLRPD